MAVLVGFPALQFLQPVQFSDGGITVGQFTLLLQQGFAPLHQPGQGHLLLIGQQIHPADVLQIQPQQIRRAAAPLAGFPGPSRLTGQRIKKKNLLRVDALPSWCSKSAESLRDF